MNATEIKFYIVAIIAIVALFLITWRLDVRDAKEAKKAEHKKVWWTFRSIRKGK